MTNRLTPFRRGVAMMIVMVVVGLCTVLSFALVSSQSVLVQASGNGARAAQADALAESGLALATYYLQNPADAPVLNSDGYYPGETGVSLGSTVNGTVDITVTKSADGSFDISCRGSSGSDTTISRNVSARAAVSYAYVPTEATTVNGALNLYSSMKITGSVRANGAVNASSGSIVNGTLYAPSIMGSLNGVTSTVITTSNGASSNPTPTTLKNYHTYTYGGKTYNAVLVQPTGVSGTLGATAANPLGVYYAASDLTVTSPLTVNGTLYIPNGKLNVKSNVTVNAPSGMPALIVKNDITFTGSSRNLNATGLSWVGGKITKTGITSNNNVTFTGALLFGGANAVDGSLSATVNIIYNKAKATVSGFTGTDTTAYSIRLTSFSSSAALAD